MAARVVTGVRLALLAVLALPRVTDAAPDSRARMTGRPVAPPAIVVAPAVTAPRQPIHIVVRGLAPGGSVSLELAGATSRQAGPLPPLPLHFVAGAWFCPRRASRLATYRARPARPAPEQDARDRLRARARLAARRPAGHLPDARPRACRRALAAHPGDSHPVRSLEGAGSRLAASAMR
jgi:hypothetical protein